nr:TIGR01244 family sulfur transferase [uncultured Rhodoferax sp.]
MSIPTRAISETFAVAAQINPADVALAKAQGFKSIINNRPDMEGGAEQPASSSIAAAAEAAGMAYVHIPVVSGAYSPEAVAAMRHALDTMPKPILGFCRSGMRAGQMHDLAQSQS